MKNHKIQEYYNLDYIHKKYRKDFFKLFKKNFINSNFILGEELKNFELNFAKFVKAKFCIGVGSGFDALKLILMAHNISYKDEIIVSSHTFIATWHSISATGAKPIPVDAKYNTYNIDVDLIESKITNKTKAIVAVHIYGQPVESDRIRKICKKYKLLYFEDAAQAHGAKYINKFAGNLSDAAAFSFYPTKNIGALGDGGAITTNNYKIYLKLKKLRNYGSIKKNNYEFPGINSRLDEIQASFLNFKLSKFKEIILLKNKIALMYNDNLPNIKDEIELPISISNITHAWHHYVVKVRRRSKLIKFLNSKGIKTMIHYSTPPHKSQAYKFLKIDNKQLKVTELLSKRILSLPSYDLSLAKKVIKYIKLFYDSNV